jgi:hypothetical protein
MAHHGQEIALRLRRDFRLARLPMQPLPRRFDLKKMVENLLFRAPPLHNRLFGQTLLD